MEIYLQNISKRYLYEWIIRDFNFHFKSGSITGVNGINGSGKSTLIKMISGYLSPSEGQIKYTARDQKTIGRDDIFSYVSMTAPYTDLIQEYDAQEMFDFHKQFKKLRLDIDNKEFLEIVKLEKTKGKAIQYFSSGMKQRLQLALSILTDSEILLLDEPTSYLDEDNRQWYYDLLGQHISKRTTIIASNDVNDFAMCGDVVKLT